MPFLKAGNSGIQTPVLFLFAHHDDELFVATLLRQLAAGKEPIICAWLTRGGLGAREREAESIRAMAIVGIPRDNLRFFRLPDGDALDHLDEIVDRLARLLQGRDFRSVFVPAFEGGHPDHDTAQLAAALALKQHPGKTTLFEFPLYNRYKTRLLRVGEFIPGTTPLRMTPVSFRDRLLKRKLAGVFASQRWLTMPLLGVRGGPLLLHTRGEPFRRVPAGRDYTRRPHPGRLAYEYYTRRRFAEFAAKVSARKQPLPDMLRRSTHEAG